MCGGLSDAEEPANAAAVVAIARAHTILLRVSLQFEHFIIS